MIILGVREAGHAIAMWAFGYRNISVMFVPLLGALVTANPKEIPVWKQAIMLLAGPVPGFVAGVAALLYLKEHPLNAWGVPWTKVAVWAAVINLLNLLPINPLDGGKVFDIALFSRWPRARLVFVALSSIVIFSYSVWAESYILLIVGAFLLGGVYTQRRIMTLQLAWQEGLSRRDQLKNLFRAARVSFKNPSFATILPAVKAVFTL